MSFHSHHKEHHHHDAHHKPHHDIHTHTTTHHDHPRPFRLTRVADCTIAGHDLRVRETKMIAAKLNFQPNEEIEIIYSKSDQFESYFELHDQVIVGLTNFRIFKLEKGSITQTYLQDVVSVSHQKNGIFSWDKVDCKLRNGSCETFGIYEGKTCGFFVQHVQNHINKRPQGNGHHHHHHDHCSPTSSTTTTIIYPNGGSGMVVPQIQPQVQPQYQPIPNGMQPVYPNNMQPQYQPIPNGMQPQYQPMYPQQQMYPAQGNNVIVQPGYGSGAPSNPPAYAPQ